ncbi:metal ABC transporter permease [Frankia sp. CNm7]|uniref:Metal ABC transporter permease n=1 Tax=Frankia nepalensis TaxID=1836974 RepID=A0A937RF80_9ACTN|nr:metal ABC transporter permease [Frankia nepalensis]MBL7514485.1 metal ABC transporter permease [Frankia nepalensis]MBL7518567.1 metal ABC transporter permease [Frankia nepalensis]MBL7627754.1 metal ABC transporter permease [Frankia nepalensis]
MAPFERPYLTRALVELLLLGGLAAVVGVFVLLRRLAFLADALTHTVFPGVVVGFLIGGTQGIFPGALVVAAVAAGLFTLLAATRRVAEDAALAILLTGFFALGVVLVSRRSSYTADLTAFLFGRVLTVRVADIVATAAVAVVVLAVLAALRKELLLVAFDPQGARAAGYRVAVLDLVLNLAIALVVVAAVRAVGTVLVIALIVVPAATARLLSDRFAVVTVLAAALGMAGGWIGLLVSYKVSVDHGVRLATGATVVLVLVAGYLLALAADTARRHAKLAKPRATAGPPTDAVGAPADTAVQEAGPRVGGDEPASPYPGEPRPDGAVTR